MDDFLIRLVDLDSSYICLSVTGMARFSLASLGRFVIAESFITTLSPLLHQAVSSRLVCLVHLLLAVSADPTAPNLSSGTVISYAIRRDSKPRSEEQRHSILKLLMSLGCRRLMDTAIDRDNNLVVDFLVSRRPS